MNPSFGSEFVTAAKQSPRLFFAPLVGAIKAIRLEFQRVKRGQTRNVKQMQSK